MTPGTRTRRWPALLGLCTALAILASGVLPAIAAPAPRDAQVDAPLKTLARQRPHGVVRVIVQGPRVAELENATRRKSAQLRQRMPHLGGIAVDVRADQIEALAKERGVKHIAIDPLMRMNQVRSTAGPHSAYAETVRAPLIWAAGKTGKGVGIAVLDSGIQANKDLASRVVHQETFSPGASSHADQLGHGTWVASIAAGDGTQSGGAYKGIAPGASIINLKVSDSQGRAYGSDIISALGWVAQNHEKYNIRVVNLSFVSSLKEGYATSLLAAAVEMVWHSGVVVVVSSGNEGPHTSSFAPANDPYVITVGAGDDKATDTPKDDLLALFSSFGPTQDGFAKPDLVAPGRRIVGALASKGALLAKQHPDRIIGNEYIQLSGTSASAPVVAGSVALLLQIYPDLTPNQVKWLLTRTTQPIAGAKDGIGAGLLDIASAATYRGSRNQANQGLVPNKLVAEAYKAATGGSGSWDSVSWVSVSWDSVSWDSVSWDSVSWDSVSWDSVSWDSVSWDNMVDD